MPSSSPPRRPAPTRTRLFALGAALALAGCVLHPSTAPTPGRAPGAAEMDIYRLVAESVYVRTTSRSVGVVSTLLDTACTGMPCRPFPMRWGLDPLWWANGDTTAAAAARDDLLARISDPMTLAGVPAGQTLLQSVAPDSAARVVARSDTAHWTAFKAHHGGTAGFLWFSPIGFDAQRKSAIVFVDWRCGPACGHDVAVALRAVPGAGWQISDMLLVLSRGAEPDPARP
ncbi:MAG TPA: hypothetical protein VMV51_12475 [Gemmatimonadaceae bacterium]|nr:hypothetical protein [Gemmatimonadaceae bacterium]